MATWATTAQVLTLTAATVTEVELARAEAVIALACGRDPATTAAGALTVRDLHWLKAATCYQAAWAQAQPDLFTRSGVTTINQDGQQVTFTPTGQTLAPLAAKALKRLSWKGTTSVHVQGAMEQAAAALPVGSAVLESADDTERWVLL